MFKAEIGNCSGNRKATLLCRHELHLWKAEKACSGLKSDLANPDANANADVIPSDLQRLCQFHFGLPMKPTIVGNFLCIILAYTASVRTE